MRSLKSRLRQPLLWLIGRLARRLGYRLSERGYYSPLLDPETLPRDFWTRPRQTPGLSIEPSEHLDFLECELAPYVREFDPPHRLDGTRNGGFYLHNGFYGSVDAEILYAVVRRAKPQRIVELGSGYSTLVIAEAIAANDREGRPARYRVFDPYAGDHLRMDGPGPVEIDRTPATDVPMAEFEALEADDILFADTTHTVKTAGEVDFLVLQVLPHLRPGVIVHMHDIFLPWEYPRYWVESLRRSWSEQYLLQAFLAFNPDWKVLFASHAVAQAAPERLKLTIPSFCPDALEMGEENAFMPGAFWLRRRAASPVRS